LLHLVKRQHLVALGAMQQQCAIVDRFLIARTTLAHPRSFVIARLAASRDRVIQWRNNRARPAGRRRGRCGQFTERGYLMPVTYDLNGKAAVVTGGAKGIGKAIVERLSHSGAQVHV
jgi:3-oxoacyl-ACP reductase-like protein